MPKDTQVNNLIVNRLTRAQYKALEDAGTVSNTELYVITDDNPDAAVWGSISGTLTNQTDLKNALDGKQANLSEAQLSAANSGITSTKVSTYDGYATSISGKADKATTLSGYGITDAKIDEGTITLGTNTITPLTAESSLDATKLSGTASINTTGNAATASSATKASQDGRGNTISTTYATKTELGGKQDTLTSANAGSGISIENGIISNTQTSAEWGNITGSLDTQSDLKTALDAKANSADLKTVATSGSYNDLTNKPSIPTITDTYSATSSNGMSGKAVASAISGKQASLSEAQLAAANSGITATKVSTYDGYATTIAGKANSADLADVATSGSYNDLSDTPSEVTESTVSGWGFTKNTGTYSKPTGGIPKTDLASDVQTSLGKADTALQGITSSQVTTALGYTPYNSTNPNGYTSNEGTITGIKMNGASVGTSGEVDLGTVITSHQDISGKADKATTLAGYGITDAYTKTEVDNKVAAVYKYKGSVANYAALPTTGQVTGDVYNVEDTGMNYAWDGKAWDALSTIVDLSPYAKSADLATVATSGSYNDLSNKPTIPAAVTESTVSGWGFTKNTGTLTGVKMNGAAKTVTDGVVDLGTVITAHQDISGKANTADLATVATSGSYDDLSNKPTIPSEVTESTVSGWGFTKNTGTYSKPSTGIPKTDLASAVQTSLGKADSALQSISSSDVTTALGYTPYDSTNPNGYTSNVGTVTSVNNVAPVNGNVTINIPSAVTETTVSGWGFTKNVGTITGATMNGANVTATNGVLALGTVITSHQDISGKANTADLSTVATTGSYNDLTNKPSIPTITDTYSATSTNGMSGKAVASAISNKMDKVTLATVATSGSYNDLSNKPTIPSAVTETTVSGWGFTKNAGTITGIKMNGASKGTSGEVDLGTVLTSHQSLDSCVKTTGDQTVAGTKTFSSTISGSINGNAATATKATQDGSGNTITTYYQPKLTAGTNITITGNTISAAGGGAPTYNATTETLVFS